MWKKRCTGTHAMGGGKVAFTEKNKAEYTMVLNEMDLTKKGGQNMMKKNKAWAGVLTVITMLVMLATGTVSIAENVSGLTTSTILAASSKAESSNSSSKKAKSVSVTGSKYVAVGKTIALTAKVSPEKADQTVVWTSSDKKIATVTNKGKVKGIKAGTAKITATSKSNPKVSKTWKITVTKKAVSKVMISGNVDSLDLSGKKTVTLKATASPSKAAQSFEWKSSDASIATVTEKGKVTAKSTGKVKITATATDGSKKKQTIAITVIDSKKDASDKTADGTQGENENEDTPTTQEEAVSTSTPDATSETTTIAVVSTETSSPTPAPTTASTPTGSSESDASEVTVTPAPETNTNTPAQTTFPENTQDQATPTPAPTTTNIEYTRIMTQIFGELIPFETTYIDDDTMYVDAPEIVVTSGLEGKKETEWKVYFLDDVEVNRVLVGITTTKEPTTKVVKRGTKQHDIQVKTETREETIQPGITYIDDDAMYVDDPEVTVSEGTTGSKTVTLDVTYVDGVRTDEKIVSETIITAASDKQVRRGTKEHVYSSDTDTIVWGKAENGNDIKTTYKTYYKDGEVISREPYTITEYEYVYIDYESSGAVRTETCDNIAKEWAMAMAKNKVKYGHTDIQRIESIISRYEDKINSVTDIATDLKEHGDTTYRQDVYGVGVIKIQTTWVSDGDKSIPLYIACTVGYYKDVIDDHGYYFTNDGGTWIVPE